MCLRASPSVCPSGCVHYVTSLAPASVAAAREARTWNLDRTDPIRPVGPTLEAATGRSLVRHALAPTTRRRAGEAGEGPKERRPQLIIVAAAAAAAGVFAGSREAPFLSPLNIIGGGNCRSVACVFVRLTR